MASGTIIISKEKYSAMENELKTLRNSAIHKRLLYFEKNISPKKFSRADLGF